MEKIIDVKNLVFGYEKGNSILNDVSFSIEKGEYVTLIGHNGSGKSTLAKLLSYILEPNSGEIYIDGDLLNDEHIKEIRNKIGIVFQNPDNQFIGSTVEDDIAFGLENRNVEKEEMQKRVIDVAKKVGMENYLSKQPEELSGGQKQRVAIARAIINHPRILLADEPTGALDQASGKAVMELFKELNNEGVTIIMITHDASVASHANKVLHIIDGEIIENKKGGAQ